MVNSPATALMVVSGISVGLFILVLVISLPALVTGVFKELEQGSVPLKGVMRVSLGLVGLTLNIVLNAFVFSAAQQMRHCRKYSLCRTASILSLVPFSPCWILGIPFGIWALVVLNRQEVRDAFMD